MVMELLNCMEGEKEDGCQDPVDILFEETVHRTRRHEEYYSNYQRYQLCIRDRPCSIPAVISCNRSRLVGLSAMIFTLLSKLAIVD